ncbi:gamma-glutamyltransferase family protein [Bauldia litoralis]|uniref:gamma-glutamyltransferase family protein n=2 Tax=Bauldia litoralis TaxID=665467 RepID=UPI003264B8C2
MSETAVGENGMVVAPHRAAAEAGADVLRAGGNAVEAMIAAAASIAVVYPHMNGIGGDAFFLIAEQGKPPRVIDACGRAGSLATLERYSGKGHDTIPSRGADAALTVAGAVSGWILASEIAAALGGRMPRRDLLGAAIQQAKEGSAVTRSFVRCILGDRSEMTAVPGFADHYLIDGKPPEIGSLFVQERLADTLEQLSRAGFADFYRGDIAAEIAADLEAAEAPVTRDDLRKQEAVLRRPLSVPLADATLFNTPPPTQGLASLIILALFDRLGVKRGESFEHVHGLIEAAKQAFDVRDREIRDPDHAGDIDQYLDAGWLDETAARIDMKRAALQPAGNGDGDTIWMGAIDGNGLAVSFIQSLYWEFGSGVVLPKTGITWQNRGISFSLDPRSDNPLMPGRKPFHTLNPAFARFKDGRSMVYGSMGGDGQPQFQSAIFSRYARFGMEPAEAIAAPRWRWGRTWGEGQSGIEVENRFDPDLLSALERAGHTLNRLDEAYSDGMGHAGMIIRRADGRFSGASDPRCDGEAVPA